MIKLAQNIKKTSIALLILGMCTGLLWRCDISDNTVEPGISFTKIYNDERFESDYSPMALAQTSDSGYLVLNARNAWNTYLLATDMEGNFKWDLDLDDNQVNPLQGLFKAENGFYFFCMDDVSLATYLMKVDEQNKTATIDKTFDDIIYPLAVSAVDGGYLLLSYDREALASRLTKLDASFNEQWQKNYDVLEDVEEPIISHLTRIGQRLPFFTGSAGTRYFFNGFVNFSFSLVFVNTSDGKQSGVVNGFRDKGAISSVTYLQQNKFALSRFSFGDNFIIPNLDIDMNGTGFSSELGGNEHPEMTGNAPVYSNRVDINGSEIVFFTTNTKSGQILLYAYDANSGQLRGTLHLGQLNAYHSVMFQKSGDGGLVVLGSSDVAGRFSRICLFKLSQQQIINFIH